MLCFALALVVLVGCGDSGDEVAKAPGDCKVGEEVDAKVDPDFEERLGIKFKSRVVVVGCVKEGTLGGREVPLIAYRLGRPAGDEGSDVCVQTWVADEAVFGPSCNGVGPDSADDNQVRGGGDIDVKFGGAVEDPGGEEVQQNAQGTTSPQVEAVRVHYTDVHGEKATADATLVRVNDPELLSKLDVGEPFGWYLVTVDGSELNELEPLGAGGKSLGKESFRELLNRLPQG